MDTINPCPECGGRGNLEFKLQGFGFYYIVECEECGHEGQGVDEYTLGYYLKTVQEMRDTAIQSWNERWEDWKLEPMPEEALTASKLCVRFVKKFMRRRHIILMMKQINVWAKGR